MLHWRNRQKHTSPRRTARLALHADKLLVQEAVLWTPNGVMLFLRSSKAMALVMGVSFGVGGRPVALVHLRCPTAAPFVAAAGV